MKKISAEIIADSISPQGHRIISYILTYPRFIHAELMTHRMFSRNSASSRAIPFEKMVKMVEEDPFIPIAWQKDHKGMQGTEYITTKEEIDSCLMQWDYAKIYAIRQARHLNKRDVTKQLCNRLLEPFMWHTVLVTATEWDNFFELRCPEYEINWYPENRPEALEPTHGTFRSKKDAIKATGNETFNWSEIDWLLASSSAAEIHIQVLAEAMWDAMNESTPKELKAGEWHMPFMGNLYTKEIIKVSGVNPDNFELVCRKIATARAARLSYMTFEGELNYEKDIKLHDQLLESHHMSPFEHVARCMSDLEYYSFIKGQVPSTEDDWGIINYEYYPLFTSETSSEWFGQSKGENKNNGNRYGWCNNFRGFIPYRYLIENI